MIGVARERLGEGRNQQACLDRSFDQHPTDNDDTLSSDSRLDGQHTIGKPGASGGVETVDAALCAPARPVWLGRWPTLPVDMEQCRVAQVVYVRQSECRTANGHQDIVAQMSADDAVEGAAPNSSTTFDICSRRSIIGTAWRNAFIRGTSQWLRNAVVDVRVTGAGAVSARSRVTTFSISPNPEAVASYRALPCAVIVTARGVRFRTRKPR